MAAINTAWVNNLTAQVNSVNDCASLQLVATFVEQAMTAQIEAQIRQMTALAGLCVSPTDLPSTITFLAKLVAFYEVQYAQAVASQVALLAAYTELLAAISAKIGTLGCTISLPSLPTLPTPPI
jgi:uncharacterized protein (DUF885 family)